VRYPLYRLGALVENLPAVAHQSHPQHFFLSVGLLDDPVITHAQQVARTCGLGPRLFIMNRALHFQIRVRPSMAGSARSLPSQIGRTGTASADVTPR